MVLKSGFRRPEQPDHLDVAVAFGLKPTARPHPVEIAVDVELQQIGWRIAGAARRLRRDAFEPRRREIEPVDKGVDEPNGIVGDDIIVDRLWQQQKLRTFESGNVNSCQILARRRPRRNPISATFHTVCLRYARRAMLPERA